MSSCIYKDSGISYLYRMQGTNVHKLIISSLNIYKQPLKLKKSESNKNLKVKKNINFYILLQIIFPKRRCV